MLDIKFIRKNPEKVREMLENRRSSFDLDAFLALDKERLDLLARSEDLKSRQNKINAEIKTLLKDKKDPQAKIAESKDLKAEIEKAGAGFKDKEIAWYDQSLRIPNMIHSSVPLGDASCNKIVRENGDLPRFDFAPRDHIELAESLGMVDFKCGAKLSGSNFVLYKGWGASLERALINFMLDLHTREHGYQEILPPKLVNGQSMQATGQLPNLRNDMYALEKDEVDEHPPLYLIPTAEVPVTNIFRDDIIDEKDLPVYYAAYTPCFRREAGSYGKDTRGLMRLHEFNKVELVKFSTPDESYAELEKLLNDACRVLDILKLPYRVLSLASADISFAAAKCYDIEVYAPGIDRWLEVSSCSNFEDFQARRGSIRYRAKSGKLGFVHTLNGSGLALPRLAAAIMENYQDKDGSIVVPDALRSYLYGRERITR